MTTCSHRTQKNANCLDSQLSVLAGFAQRAVTPLLCFCDTSTRCCSVRNLCYERSARQSNSKALRLDRSSLQELWTICPLFEAVSLGYASILVRYFIASGYDGCHGLDATLARYSASYSAQRPFESGFSAYHQTKVQLCLARVYCQSAAEFGSGR